MPADLEEDGEVKVQPHLEHAQEEGLGGLLPLAMALGVLQQSVGVQSVGAVLPVLEGDGARRRSWPCSGRRDGRNDGAELARGEGGTEMEHSICRRVSVWGCLGTHEGDKEPRVMEVG